MEPTRVGVIGAGIAGPVVASLLKLKGFEPLIFERNPAVSQGGIGIGIQPNGQNILARIPGLVESLPGRAIDYFNFYSVLPEDKGVLAELDGPKRRREAMGGRGALGMRRSDLQRTLVATTERLGVPIRWGHHLTALEQREQDVLLTFSNGAQETVSFVVGCDGLHSDTRKALFGEQPADYTGLVQVGGYAPAPARFEGRSVAMNVLGDGMHMIAIPVDETTMGFAITMREPETKETWRAMDADVAEEFKRSTPVAQWDYGAGEIIQNATGLIKYGLYDRPELATWHKGRVVLIGDAAHPTSPHLGQGANQSLEDAGLLVDLLAEHCSALGTPATRALEVAFTQLETVRIPRTAELVKKARAQGETRVVHGTQACMDRNNWYRKLLSDEALMRERFGGS